MYNALDKYINILSLCIYNNIEVYFFSLYLDHIIQEVFRLKAMQKCINFHRNKEEQKRKN